MFDEYNDYEEYENNGYNDEIQEAAERARESFILKAISENYTRITSKGFSAKDISNFTPFEIKDINETINLMIDHFESSEEYEKCAVLVKALDAINNQKDFEPIS
jgi:hypothetical protein